MGCLSYPITLALIGWGMRFWPAPAFTCSSGPSQRPIIAVTVEMSEIKLHARLAYVRGIGLKIHSRVLHLFLQPDLDQRLIRNVSSVGSGLNGIKKMLRKP